MRAETKLYIVVADDKLPEFADENLPVPVQE
jgi:hypothetical protein